MASLIPKLELDVATRALRRDYYSVREFAIRLQNKSADCAPAKYRFYGNRYYDFNIAALDSVQREFIRSMEWLNGESNLTGHVICESKDIASSVSATFKPLRWEQERLIEAATAIFCAAEADIGFFHGFTESERQHLHERELVMNTDRAGKNWFYSVPSRRLRFGLPDLAWVNIFGSVYIKHFGRERLLSSPAFRVTEIYQDVVLLQLVDDYDKIATDWPSFNRTREAVIDHLGRDSFQGVRGPSDPPAPMGPGTIYNEGLPASRVPEFGF